MATEVDKADRIETLQQAFYEYQTVTNKTLLELNKKIGSGGDSGVVVDTELSETSINPVQNKVITSTINEIRTLTQEELASLTAKVGNKVDKDNIKTVYGQTLIGRGDVKAETLTDNDINTIFNEA